MELEGLNCFDNSMKTLEKWSDEITNYFIGRRTSGFVEGLNNRIKVIKRRCYGNRVRFPENSKRKLKEQVSELRADPEKVREKPGWVKGYEEQITEREDVLRIAKTAEDFVRKGGIRSGTCRDLSDLPDFQARTDRSERVRRQLLAFLAEDELQVRPGERILGSSGVIGSVFGRLKRPEQDQAKSGFTSLLICVAAMVAVTTAEVVRKATEKIPTKKVSERCGKILGKSVQAKRKEAFSSPPKTEQKRDQFQGAA